MADTLSPSSQGGVVRALQGGQVFYEDDTPFAIPDQIWDVLWAHKDAFPYKPPKGESEVQPWRVHWMVR